MWPLLTTTSHPQRLCRLHVYFGSPFLRGEPTDYIIHIDLGCLHIVKCGPKDKLFFSSKWGGEGHLSFEGRGPVVTKALGISHGHSRDSCPWEVVTLWTLTKCASKWTFCRNKESWIWFQGCSWTVCNERVWALKPHSPGTRIKILALLFIRGSWGHVSSSLPHLWCRAIYLLWTLSSGLNDIQDGKTCSINVSLLPFVMINTYRQRVHIWERNATPTLSIIFIHFGKSSNVSFFVISYTNMIPLALL